MKGGTTGRVRAAEHDPFVRGGFPVGVRTIQARDEVRDRLFSCEIWYPAAARHVGEDMAVATQDAFTHAPGAAPRSQMAVRDAAARAGTYPLVIFSHSSENVRRRQSTFLCTHLASHGYIVAAMDHSETFAPELVRKEGETAEQKAARIEGWIGNRVPDVRFVLDHLLEGNAWDSEAKPDAARVGIIGHSFGGWTALAAPEAEPRIRAVVALAPAGSSSPPPGIIPAKLTFDWGRDVPTLYLVAEDDMSLPLAGMHELFERTAATKRMVVLRRADHGHFADEFEGREGLCSAQEAHAFVRSLTLCHLDAFLKQQRAAMRFLESDVAAKLAKRGIAAHDPENSAPRDAT